MTEKKHLKGVRKKMARRDASRKGPHNKAPNAQRFKVPAAHTLGTKPIRPRKVKPSPGPRGEPGSRQRSIGSTGTGTPQVNRRTGKPHEHKREIARTLRRARS